MEINERIAKLEECEKYDNEAHNRFSDKISRIEVATNEKFTRLETKIDNFAQILNNASLANGALFKDEFRDFKNEMKEMLKGYVMLTEFKPIQRIVYGAVSIILVAVLGGIVALILK